MRIKGGNFGARDVSQGEEFAFSYALWPMKVASPPAQHFERQTSGSSLVEFLKGGVTEGRYLTSL